MTDQFITSAFRDIMAQLRALQGPWEYKFLVLPFSGSSGVEESHEWLNTEGSQGWEVVAVVPAIPKTTGRPSQDCLAVMKRPKKAVPAKPSILEEPGARKINLEGE